MQDLFGSMRQRAGDLMGDVSSEVDRQRQIRQLEKQIATLEQEIHLRMVQIGELVIERYRQGMLQDPTLGEPCQQVLSTESRLSDLNRQKTALQQAPETKAPPEAQLCPQCGGELPHEGEFCPHCGMRFAAGPPAFIHCANCGAEMAPGAIFCGDCGQRMDAIVATATVVRSIGHIDHQVIPAQTPALGAPPSAGPTCEHCQAPLEQGAKFCGECGWLIEEAEEPDLEPNPDDDIVEEELGHENQPAGEEEPEELIQAEAGTMIEDLAPGELAESADEETLAPEDEGQTVVEVVEAEEVLAKTDDRQTCVNCGGLLRPGATFCPSCGEQVLAFPAPEENPARSHCGMTLEDSMRYCPKCGEEVPFDRVPDRLCTFCGATIRAGAHFCPDCGQPAGAS